MVHHLTQDDARRIAVQGQLLDLPRPRSVLEVVRHLTVLQPEPTKPIAPSADLVLWSRLGSSYDPGELVDAIEQQDLLEHQGYLRPAEDLALYRAEMAHWPGLPPRKQWQDDNAAWVEANDGCRLDLLERLRQDGPLPMSELPDTCEVPWRSSGWNDDRNVRMLLKLMVARGEVAAAGQEGRVRLWDLAERVYPDDPVPDVHDALRIRDERRLRALGIARARGTEMPGESIHVGQAGEAAVVEGVRGEWRVEPSLLDRPFTPRTALLSPFDRMVQDRKRLADLFGYEYLLEMYKPVEKRRWGYYALPILHGDRFVGKLDATAERDEGVLRVDAVHREPAWEHGFDDAIVAGVRAEIEDLAHWLRVEPMWPDGWE